MLPSAPIHLIVRLPYNRPEEPDQQLPEPPHIIWNADKESVLWELIARSRMSENAATDWQGLSAHLGVPLPYLLYRAQARYEQDLKGLQHVGGALSGTPQVVPRALPGDEDRPRPRISTGAVGVKPAVSTSPTRLRHSGGSSSTFTLKQRRSHARMTPLPPKPPSPVESESDDDESDQAEAEEEEQRREEQEMITRKLKDLERMMSADMLGFARSPRRTNVQRSTSLPVSPERPAAHPASPTQQAGNTSSSTSSSVRGSIPSIPSPPSTSQTGSVHTRSKPHSPSPSTRHFRGLSIPTARSPAVERAMAIQRSSNHGSSASSFSDVDMSDASLSASALEDALMSNMKGGGASRLSSVFSRSHFSPRGAQS
ncbi:hypothetical protein EXIGLDRAFT_716175 [Exidia glandulosa HHB12029]|uniref:Autophagy-related protein 29 n=1 Tax=Exidia glandulosa HHB12029 TaxID=1314781 RepID=A0A165QWW0_EXIGL|nr:hypothetical protein EXIGLDRAFT_716175 [Exidia glandulosa HHB12029]